MSKILRIEGITNPGAKFYSLIVIRSPVIKELYKDVAEEICSRISSGKILDVGTGPGYLPLEMTKRSPSLEIIGIDISPAMVNIALKNAKKVGLSERARFQIGNAANLPFEDGYFDFVVSTLSLHHWLKPVECLKELHRVLKEKGEAWIYDIRRDVTKDVKAQVRNRYGWLMYFIHLYIVRSHSSISWRDAEALLSHPEIGFSETCVEHKGAFLKLRLLK